MRLAQFERIVLVVQALATHRLSHDQTSSATHSLQWLLVFMTLELALVSGSVGAQQL